MRKSEGCWCQGGPLWLAETLCFTYPRRFETVVNVGGFDVTVRGAVVDGIAKIGTAFR
jgi:hypothetical protein